MKTPPNLRRAVDKYRATERGKENHSVLARKWRAANLEKVRAMKAAYHRANRVKVMARIRVWQLANSDMVASYKVTTKAKRKGASGRHTGAEIKKMFSAQQGLCALCGISIQDGYHRDHKMPLSRGGSNNIDNIQLLCAPCNLHKHAKTNDELRA